MANPLMFGMQDVKLSAPASPAAAPTPMPQAPTPWRPRRGNPLQSLGWMLLAAANPRVAMEAGRGYIGGKMRQNAAEQEQYETALPAWQRAESARLQAADDAETRAFRERQLAEDVRYHDIQDTNRDAMTGVQEQNTRLKALLPLVSDYGQVTPEMERYIKEGGTLPDMSGVKARAGSKAFGRITNAEGDIASMLYKNFEANPTGGNFAAFQEALARAGQRPQVMQWDGSQALEFSPGSTFQSRIDKHELAPYELAETASRAQIRGAEAKVKTDPGYIAAKVAEPAGMNRLRNEQGDWLSLQPGFRTRSLDQGDARIGETVRHNRTAEGIAAGNLAESRRRTALAEWKAKNPEAAKATTVGRLTSQLATPDRNLLYAAHTFGANPQTTEDAVEVIAMMAELERAGAWKFKRGRQGITGVDVADPEAVKKLLAPYRKKAAKPAQPAKPKGVAPKAKAPAGPPPGYGNYR